MRTNKVHRTKTDTIVMWVVFAVFALYALSLLFPFFWCLMNSFKTRKEFFRNINGLPEIWSDRKLGEKFFAVCGPRAPAYDVFQQPVYDFGCDFSFPDVLLGDRLCDYQVRVSRQGCFLFVCGHRHDDPHHGIHGFHL